MTETYTSMPDFLNKNPDMVQPFLEAYEKDIEKVCIMCDVKTTLGMCEECQVIARS